MLSSHTEYFNPAGGGAGGPCIFSHYMWTVGTCWNKSQHTSHWLWSPIFYIIMIYAHHSCTVIIKWICSTTSLSIAALYFFRWKYHIFSNDISPLRVSLILGIKEADLRLYWNASKHFKSCALNVWVKGPNQLNQNSMYCLWPHPTVNANTTEAA